MRHIAEYLTSAVEHIADAYESQPADLPKKWGKVIIPEALRWEVFERDNFTCQHCGTRRMLRADHIHPEAKGGVTILSNLQTLCNSCNSRKGSRINQ